MTRFVFALALLIASLSFGTVASADSACNPDVPGCAHLYVTSVQCDEAFVVAYGQGLDGWSTWQLVANREVHYAYNSGSNVIVSRFITGPGWVQATIRTQYGGYYGQYPTFAWVYVPKCPGE